MSRPLLDLHRTSGCPRGHRCESCGAERGDLSVVTAAIGNLGVACLTMCPRCAGSTAPPPVSPSTAVRLVQHHAAHLGIDAAQMTTARGRTR